MREKICVLLFNSSEKEELNDLCFHLFHVVHLGHNFFKSWTSGLEVDLGFVLRLGIFRKDTFYFLKDPF